MPKRRKPRYCTRFQRMGEEATRKWLVSAKHHLRRQQEHVNSAQHVLAEFERRAAQESKPQPVEQAHG